MAIDFSSSTQFQKKIKGKKVETDILNKIFKDYELVARPIKDPSLSLKVEIGFHLTRLDSMELRNNKITTTGWLTVEWKDQFLKWNVSQFNNISKLVIPASKVWKPDLALDNSADVIYTSIYNEQFQVELHHDGLMRWTPGGSFSTVCYFDIKWYPFDHQTCEIVFVSWHYTKDMLNFTGNKRVVLESYWKNGEWDLVYTGLSVRDWMYSEKPLDIYPEIVITIHIRRKVLFYILTIIIPCLMMSLLVLMVFHLPPDAGEKVSLGVTVLLAFSVFQLMIAESVPTSSDSTPMLEIYLLFFMTESTFSVAISVIVLNLHLRTEYKPPPEWLRKIVLHWMAKMVGMEVMKVNSVGVESEARMDIKKTSSLGVDSDARMSFSSKEHLITIPEIHIKKDDSDQSICSQNENEENSRTKLVPPIITIIEPKTSDIELQNKVSSHCRVHLNNPNGLSRTSSTTLDKEQTNLSPKVARSALRVMKSIANLDHLPRNQSRMEFMTLIKDTYRDLCQQREDDELELLFENEWKRIARVVDRFFFLVTVTVILISSIVIFSVIPY